MSMEKQIYKANQNLSTSKKQQNNKIRINKTNENGKVIKKRKLYSSCSDTVWNDKNVLPKENSFNSASEYIRLKSKINNNLKNTKHNLNHFNLENKTKSGNKIPSKKNNPFKINFELSPFKLDYKIEQDPKLIINKSSFPVDSPKYVSEERENCFESVYSVIQRKIDINKEDVKQNFPKTEIKSRNILRTENNIETKINLKTSSNKLSTKTSSAKTQLGSKLLLSSSCSKYISNDKNISEAKHSDILDKIYTKSDLKQNFSKNDISCNLFQTENNIKATKLWFPKPNTKNEQDAKLIIFGSNSKCVFRDKNMCEPKNYKILTKFNTKSEVKHNVENKTLFNLSQKRAELFASEHNIIQSTSNSKSPSTKSLTQISNRKIVEDKKLLSFDSSPSMKLNARLEQHSKLASYNIQSITILKSPSIKSLMIKSNTKIKETKKLQSFGCNSKFDSPSKKLNTKQYLKLPSSTKLSPSGLSTKNSKSSKEQDSKLLVSARTPKLKNEDNLKLWKTVSVAHNSKCTSNDQNEFLFSLSDSVSKIDSHPDSLIYKENFKETKQQLTERLFKLYNTEVFENKIPNDTKIEWSNRMVSSAGFTINKRAIKLKSGEQVYSSHIKLSTKVVDRPSRLRDVLIHEMCHAITWIVHNIKDGHGTLWTTWAQKAMKTFPSLPMITRCHSYEVKMKYRYCCKGCGYSFERQTKSINIEQKCCGYCKGRFEIILNKS